MNLPRKAKTPLPSVAEVEAETQDEIEQIMSEIEELQQEMSTAAASAVASPAPRAAAPAPAAEQGAAPPKLRAVPVPEAEAEAPTPVAEAALDGEDVMSEFKGGEDGPGMEETLANLKQEENPGRSLIDDAIHASRTEASEDTGAETNFEATAEAPGSHADAHEGEIMAPTTQNPRYDESATPSAAEDAGGTLTMTLKGNMTLRLKYDFEGQEVVVAFSDHNLKIAMADGTEFKIPVGQGGKKQFRKAA
jgi:hypothetical protein